MNNNRSITKEIKRKAHTKKKELFLNDVGNAFSLISSILI